MKKFFKGLAMLLALTLVIGTIPASAKVYEKKELYLGGAKGTVTVDGVVTAKAKQLGKAKIFKLVGFKKADAAEHEIEAKLADGANEGIVKITDTYVKAKAIGTTSVDIFVDGAKKTTVAFTVKANDTEVELTGLADGETYALNKAYEYTVKGNNGFDKVALKADSENVEITDTTVTFKAEGTYKITAYSYQSDKYTDAIATKAITVEAGAAFSAVATGAKEITVLGAAADAKFTVKRGNVAIDATATTVEGVTKLALANKLKKATYTVSDGTNTVTFEADDEKVDEIIIKEANGQVNTNEENALNKITEAYIHYDVLNQYGESVRKSFAPSWTSSVGTAKADATTGIITVTNPDGYKYNDFISIVAVYTKGTNALSAQANVTVGLPQAVGQIKVEGIVLDGTTKLLDEVPADFKNKTYYVAYSMKDANGYDMKYSQAQAGNVTINSYNPLVATIKNEKDAATGLYPTVTIDGVVYGLFTLTAGESYKQGGYVDYIAISGKNGQKTTDKLYVKSNQILASFTIEAPDDDIIEDEWKALKFDALDTEGAPVTNFRVLYKSITLGNYLTISENNDGTATLSVTVPSSANLADENMPGVVFLTSTVVKTGNVCNVQAAVQDAEYICGVAKYNGSDTIVKTGKITVKSCNAWDGTSYLNLYDEYDRSQVWTNDISNVNAKALGYDKIEVVALSLDELSNGTSSAFTVTTSAIDAIITVDGVTYTAIKPGNSIDLVNSNWFDDATKQFTVEFALAGKKTSGWELVPGSSIKQVFTVVDITKVSNFSLNGEAKLQNVSHIEDTYGKEAFTNSTSSKKASVSGYYGSAKVSIPDYYVTYGLGNGANAFLTMSENEFTANVVLDPVNTATNVATPAAFIDKSHVDADGKYTTRTQTKSITAVVKSATAGGINADGLLAQLSANITIAVDAAHDSSFTKNTNWNSNGEWTDADNNKLTIKAKEGKITSDMILSFLDKCVDNYGAKQSVNTENVQIKITVSGYNESEDGIKGNVNAIVKNNAEINASIENAEIGDTFKLNFSWDHASLDVDVTVGADQTASIVGTANEPEWR